MSRSRKHRPSTVEAAMVSKCANPACLAPFRYLHEGRIFTVPVEPRPDGAPIVERYWLCSSCCDTMTLVLQRGKVLLRALAAVPEAGLKPVRSASRASRCVA